MVSPAQTKAFTLTELLAAIVIIAILAALIFGAAGRMRVGAHDATCSSNLRQLGQLSLLFATDHQGHLPPAKWAGWPEAGSGTKTYSLDDYMANVGQLLKCPAEPMAQDITYGINGAVVWGVPLPWGPNYSTFSVHSPLKLSAIQEPAKLILFADSLLSRAPGQVGPYLVCGPSPTMGVSMSVSARHSGDTKFIACFVDGHIQPLTVEAALAGDHWTRGLK